MAQLDQNMNLKEQESNGIGTYVPPLFPGVVLTETTKQKRKQIKNLQDEFMSFIFDGYDAFESFGAFIVNEKRGSLKFYNRPKFSNEYSQPQFDKNGGQLIGVTFQRQSISFTVGVYWISINDYRKLLNWLDPLKISYLIFGFDNNFRYNVKLSSINDSVRWVVGKEKINNRDEPMYYTELQLSFELQGENCAIGTHPYEMYKWDLQSKKSPSKDEVQTTWSDGDEVSLYSAIKTTNEFVASDLPTQFELSLPLNICQSDESSNQSYDISLYIEQANYGATESIRLFSVSLANLTHTKTTDSTIQKLTLLYDSLTGLVYYKKGASGEVLTLLSTNDTGERIVKAYESFKFKLPGCFSDPNFDQRSYVFNLRIKKNGTKKDNKAIFIPQKFCEDLYNKAPLITCYPRTTII